MQKMEKNIAIRKGGEEFFCPICGAIWLKDIEGDVTFGDCEHLRFSLNSESDSNFDFFGDWNWDGFQDMVEEATTRART
jgi:hypothetical protein